jgi:hypothetical protein
VESVRLRSLPIQEDAGMPRKAAISSGRVDQSRGSANAFLVFHEEAAAAAALAHNMQEVAKRARGSSLGRGVINTSMWNMYPTLLASTCRTFMTP